MVRHALNFAQRFPSRYREAWHDARQIADNDYFKRLWVVQEILLPPERHILCGKVWIRTSDLATWLPENHDTAITTRFLRRVTTCRTSNSRVPWLYSGNNNVKIRETRSMVS